jgi:putative oxidoreductase
MKYIPLIGRTLFSLIFICSGIMGHMIGLSGTAAYAASKGLPMPTVLVLVSGIIALLGGVSILLGYKAKLGALLIVVFLVPVTFIMHSFWTETDPMASQIGMAMFMKNIALIGGALLIAYFGSGPVSIDSNPKA